MGAIDLRLYSIVGARPDDLPAYRAPWLELWRRLDGSPFLSPAWVLAWAEVYAPGRTYAALLWRDGALAGVLPVFVWDGALLLAGTGPSDDGGLLIDQNAVRLAPHLVEAAASMVPEQFSRIRFEALSPDSVLTRVSLPGWEGRTLSGADRALLALDHPDGFGHVPHRFQQTWGYSMRRLTREGGRVEACSVDEGLPDLFRLHRARWADKGEAGMLTDPLLARLLSRALPALARDAGARLLRVVVSGEVIAIVLLLLSGQGRRAAYFLGGFAPEWRRLSPGMVLVGAAIKETALAGGTAFDFLRGSEPYKQRWGAVMHTDEIREFVRTTLN